jgi:hypothetical protein
MAEMNKQQEFQLIIESKIKDGLSSYMDVITDYMEENNLEPKQIKKLISATLLEKIKEEAIRNRLISDDVGSKLPL